MTKSMKKIFRSIAALAVVMFAGCTNDLTDEVVVPVGGKTTVEIGFEDSRTYLGELVDGARKVYWSNGDQVNINGVTSSAVELNETKTHATFTFEQELVYPYSIFYPAEMYKDGATITLPATQGAATGSFASDTAPMAVVAVEGEPMVLKHLAAVVRLQLKGVEAHNGHKINKVEFRGNNGEQVSGEFAIDYSAVELTPASAAEADKVVSTSVGKFLSTEATTDVFIVVPAQQYTAGFSVRIIDEAGHYMDVKSAATTLEKGQILAMPVLEFVPTGTIIGVEIKSAADLVAFAKAYNAGEYAEVKPLVVTLKNDIEFDDQTNAAWTSIGTAAYDAEGAEDLRFVGYFDGKGFSIKNWHSTNKPLFAMANNSTIKDLTIDSTSSMTFSLNIIKESHYGVIVGDIFSTRLENCTNNAPVVLDNCLAEGLAVRLDIGGIVGRTNEECNVVGCINNGTIESKNTCNFGLTAANAIPGATVYIGGIVGYSRCELMNCSNTGDITSNYNARTKSTAGIAGRVTSTAETIYNCTNSGNIIDNSLRKPAAPINLNDYNRTIYVGGVVGIQASLAVEKCSNSGNITINSNVKEPFIGGVIGLVNTDTTNLSNLTNTGTLTSTSSTRYLQMGGVIGKCKVYDLSNIVNEGALSVTTVENDTNITTTLDLGGIIGRLETANAGTIDGTSSYNIVNKAQVQYQWVSTNEYAYLSVGGVIGTLSAPATIKNVKNEGYVALISNSSTNKNQTSYCGGIVGVSSVAGTTLDGCVNANMVFSQERGTLLPDETSLPLTASQGYFCGGIVAYMMGDAENKSTISNCQNIPPYVAVTASSAALRANRGYIGGIAAYARYTNISNCNSTATMMGVNTNIRLGGIAGYLYGSHIDNCSVVSDNLCSWNNTRIGGIASGVNAESSVKNSTFKGNITMDATKDISGMAVAYTLAGAVIENCGVAGSIYGETVTADNFSGLLVGDANTTPTGCYYLAE